jgi:hypothetical protein
MIIGGQKTLKSTRFLYCEYANVELYKGQKNLKELINALPDFIVLHDFGTNSSGEGNVLFKNKNYGA